MTFLFADSLTKWAPLLARFCTLPDLRVPEMLILMILPSPMNKRRWLSGFLRISEHFYSLENTIFQVWSQTC